MRHLRSSLDSPLPASYVRINRERSEEEGIMGAIKVKTGIKVGAGKKKAHKAHKK